MIIVDKENLGIPISFATGTIDLSNSFGKIALAINVFNYGLLMYALYYFRKLLGCFVKRMIFEEEICFLLDKIGSLVIMASIVQLFSDFITKLSKDEIGIELGYGPFLYLLALGLFFKVLSEVFKIGKTMKEENELTI